MVGYLGLGLSLGKWPQPSLCHCKVLGWLWLCSGSSGRTVSTGAAGNGRTSSLGVSTTSGSAGCHSPSSGSGTPVLTKKVIGPPCPSPSCGWTGFPRPRSNSISIALIRAEWFSLCAAIHSSSSTCRSSFSWHRSRRDFRTVFRISYSVADNLPLVSVRELVESDESFVIHWRLPDSRGAANVDVRKPPEIQS